MKSKEDTMFKSFIVVGASFLVFSISAEYIWKVPMCILCYMHRVPYALLIVLAVLGIRKERKLLFMRSVQLVMLAGGLLTSYHAAIQYGILQDPCSIPKIRDLDSYILLLKTHAPCSFVNMSLLRIPCTVFVAGMSFALCVVIQYLVFSHNQKTNHSSKIVIIAVLLLGLGVMLNHAAIPKYGLRINTTNSVPHHLFISKKLDQDEKPKEEEYVAFVHEKNGKYPVVKKIGGVAGDEIIVRDATIVLVSKGKEFSLQSRTSAGVPLEPISAGIIPDGYVYVYSDHERSYDSRYENFGLVEEDEVKEVLWPIF